MTAVYCTDELQIVQALLAGNLTWSDRNTGKTTGLLIAVHLKHRGDAIIVVHAGLMRSFIRNAYARMFPGDVLPTVIPSRSPAFMGTLRGNDKAVYADEFGQLSMDDRDHLARLGTRFQGGTGA